MIISKTINKVINNTDSESEALLDLTADTVAPENLLLNKTAHNRDGEGIVGEMPEGGASDYDELENRPRINSNLLTGNKTGSQLGLQNRVLASALNIGGQTVTEVEEALGSLADISKSMTGATSSAAGEGGFVPSPSAGDENKALFGDGTWKPVSGGGGGGHTILDEDGITYPQRSKLQFEGAIVSDDETNDATVVETVNPVEYEEDIYGVNLIPYPYTNTTRVNGGITFTDNGDGTITVSGKATANTDFYLHLVGEKTIKLIPGEKYVLSGSPVIGSESEYFLIYLSYVLNGAGKYIATRINGSATFVMPEYDEGTYQSIFIRIYKDAETVTNLTFKPMLRKAIIKDDTYRPYNQQSIQHQLTDQTNVLGAKNLFNFDTPTVTSQGITFANSGGIITANGTSGSSTFPFIECRKTIPAGTYIATGCPVGGGDVADPDNYQMVWRLNDGGGQILGIDYGNGFTFTLAQSAVVNVRCMTSKGMTVTNLTFKPMLRLASDPDNTYVPYAMTNRELTDKVNHISDAQANMAYAKRVSSSSSSKTYTITCTNPYQNFLITASAGNSNMSFYIAYKYTNTAIANKEVDKINQGAELTFTNINQYTFTITTPEYVQLNIISALSFTVS